MPMCSAWPRAGDRARSEGGGKGVGRCGAGGSGAAWSRGKRCITAAPSSCRQPKRPVPPRRERRRQQLAPLLGVARRHARRHARRRGTSRRASEVRAGRVVKRRTIDAVRLHQLELALQQLDRRAARAAALGRAVHDERRLCAPHLLERRRRNSLSLERRRRNSLSLWGGDSATLGRPRRAAEATASIHAAGRRSGVCGSGWSPRGQQAGAWAPSSDRAEGSFHQSPPPSPSPPSRRRASAPP